MKKDENDELRPEYRREDLGPGVRGTYLKAYRAGTNLVLLSPDVAKVFSTEQAVNDALRSLIDLAQRSVGPTKVFNLASNRMGASWRSEAGTRG